jgi:hypothetical protein
MTSELNLLKMNKFVLGKQRLTGEKADKNIVETVRAIGGLHATSATTPHCPCSQGLKISEENSLMQSFM